MSVFDSDKFPCPNEDCDKNTVHFVDKEPDLKNWGLVCGCCGHHFGPGSYWIAEGKTFEEFDAECSAWKKECDEEDEKWKLRDPEGYAKEMSRPNDIFNAPVCFEIKGDK